MKKSQWTDLLRGIKKSIGRYISLIFIVALGTAFFAGVRSAEPDMIASADKYYDESNLMDVRILGTLGLTEGDVQEISRTEGIEQAEGGYSEELLIALDNNEFVVNVMSECEDINHMTVWEGRMPEAENECFMDEGFMIYMGYEIGDTITLTNEAGEEPENLKSDTYTIVGSGTWSWYLSWSRGAASIGDGSLDAFMVVPKEAFTLDYYTVIYAMVNEVKDMNTFSDTYDAAVELVTERIEEIAGERCEIRYSEVYEDAEQALADAKEEVANGEKELEDAEKALKDGEEALKDGQKTYDQGMKEYQAGKNAYEQSKREFEASERQLESGKEEYEAGAASIKDAKKELSEAKKEISRQEHQIEESKTQVAQGKAAIEDAQKELDAAESQLNAKESEYESQKSEYDKQYKAYESQKSEVDSLKSELNAGKQKVQDLEAEIKELEAQENPDEAEISAKKAQLSRTQDEVDELQAEYDSANNSLQSVKSELDAVKSQLDAAKGELDTAKKQLTAKKEELSEQKSKIAEAEKQIEEGNKAISAAKKEIKANESLIEEKEEELAAAKAEIEAAETAIEDGRTQLNAAKTQLLEAEAELKKGQQELLDARQELEDGWKEYKEAAEEANKKLDEAKQQIAEGEEDLIELEEGRWYVLARDTVQTSVEFSMDAERIGAIGNVFPVIFFLVAALVSLTTMTRMIEEERTLIGTMKALGYGKLAIASKYILYAFSATLIGGLIGVAIGSKLLPYVIMLAYSMLYSNIQYVLTPFHWGLCFTAIGMAMICTVGAAIVACYKELLSTPAALMRPPSPKQGKRVFLEKIPFIWKSLNFSMKSTIRNLVRYKKRFFMTVFGIGGCMAILLVSFGLSDSIAVIADNQYRNIWTYSAVCGIEENDPYELQANALNDVVNNNQNIESGMLTRYVSLDASTESASKLSNLYVVEDVNEMTEYLNLHDRETKEQQILSDEGVILSEKLASVLGVTKGDLISIEINETKSKEAKVIGIAENYTSHYIYMTSNLYETLFEEPVEYNQMFLKFAGDISEEDEQLIAEYLLDNNTIISVSLVSEMQKSLDDMMNALNLVVWVLIIAAGLLVFVVLFNLNNINISERRRELASLKVLGFSNFEVAMYVYRENIFLTFFGILAGLFLGTWLHQYLILTLEVDMIMFGRDITLMSYLYSIIFTIIFAVFVNATMLYKLKQIDMVESLKSVE